jgi:hypothetical protein
VFLRFALDPWLQEAIFSSSHLHPDEVYQDMTRLPYVLKDVKEKLDNLPPETVVKDFVSRQMAALDDAAYNKVMRKSG